MYEINENVRSCGIPAIAWPPGNGRLPLDLRHSAGDNKKSLNGEIRKITDILIMEIGMRIVWLLSFSVTIQLKTEKST
jgi:hypothetical protein